MIVRCGWHNLYYGATLYMHAKEPFDDNGITDGICAKCYFLVMGEMMVAQVEKATKQLRRARELIAPTELKTQAEIAQWASEIGMGFSNFGEI
ncbi:MAG: hypothetical protein KAR06_04800 [Deltaproteobacteria bacterium]|nr:hypothetical protein [Deltaproteobacteria bacterium]